MHILHLDLAEQEQELLDYIRSQCAQCCTLYIGVCPRKQSARSVSSILLSGFRFLDFSIISRLLTSLAHLLDLLQPNHIGIGSMRSQCEMGDRRYLWDINDAAEWVTARVVNVSYCHSRLHRNPQAKSTCFTVYLSANSRYLLSYRCNTSREAHSEHRSSGDIDAFAIQIGSVLRRVLSHYRRSVRSFLQLSHQCMV